MATPRVSKRAHAEIQNQSDNDSLSTDSGSESVPVKRPRHALPSPALRPAGATFPFLFLPSEIRNMIYSYCLPPLTKLPSKNNLKTITITYKEKSDPQKSASYISASHKNPKYVNNDNLLTQELRIAARYPTQDYHADGSQWCCRHHARKHAKQMQSQTPKPTGIAILAVCKQTYDEAAPMLYSQYLLFATPDALISFAAQLSERTAKLIRHIEIQRWGTSRSGASKRLRLHGQTAMMILAEKGVTGLETLKFDGGRAGENDGGSGQGRILRRSLRRG